MGYFTLFNVWLAGMQIPERGSGGRLVGIKDNAFLENTPICTPGYKKPAIIGRIAYNYKG